MRCRVYLLLFFFPCLTFAQQKQGTLTVDLSVQNHKLHIAHAQFDSNGIAYPAGTEARLVEFLNRTFDTLDVQLRQEAGSSCVVDSKNNNESLLTCYQTLTLVDTTGEAAALLYAETPGAFIEFDFRILLFDVLAQCLWQGSPVLIDPDSFDVTNYMLLRFPLQIKAPVDPNRINIIWDKQDTLSRRQVKRVLKGLENALWFEKDIRAKLDDYYFLLNSQTDYKIGDTLLQLIPKKTGRVQVTTDNPAEIDPVYYNLLSTPQFKRYIKIPKDSLLVENQFSDQKKYNYSLYKEGQTALAQLPVFETDVFQVNQMNLHKQNYALSVNPCFDDNISDTDEEQLLDLVANKISPEQPADSSNVAMAMPVPNADGLMGASGMDNNQNEFGHSRVTADTCQKAGRFKRNYLGLGADYYIQDAVQLNAIYQRLLKDGSNLSAKVGYAFNEAGPANGGVYASANYFKDFIFFDALQKRMSVQLTGNSLFTANRILRGESLKERRSGAKIQTELEWFRNISGHLLLSRLTLASQKVTLQTPDKVPVLDTTIAFAEIGLLHSYNKNRAQFGTRLTIEPVFKFGVSGLNSDTAADYYFTSRLRVHFNQNLSKGFVFNLDAQAEYDTKGTPLFEQAALQTNLNRGFKEDAAIGRLLGNIQPEFWIPLPRFGDKQSKANQYLFQHIRFAVFADLSCFNHLATTDTRTKGNWLSPGAGIRFIQFPAQINLDLALGRGPDNSTNKRPQFSINLIVNTPL